LDNQIIKYQEQILEQKTCLGGVNAAQTQSTDPKADQDAGQPLGQKNR
jgi:hypothetical protein